MPAISVGMVRDGPGLDSRPIVASDFPVSEMWIHPVTGDLSKLDTPEIDEIQLTGKAIGIGTTQIKLGISAMPDMNYLLANDEESGTIVASNLAVQE